MNKICPNCRKKLLKIGKFWICPEHGQINFEKKDQKLRIFLSYGHDNNEELVIQIKSDLEKRGHNVWFDKNEIKSGQDWRRSITEGITQSHKFISFLSKHSTRDPGVCLDEIAIAIGVKGGNIQTILVENEYEVKAPPTLSHIQWLDMHDWKVRKAEDRIEWGKWYQKKLTEIIDIVESEESIQFAGEIEELAKFLKPIYFDSRVSQLLSKGFVGREWIWDKVEQWRNNSARASRLFWIMGGPGIGKSAFAANFTHFGKDKVIAAQFCEWDKPDHRDAARVFRSIAFQLATRLPDYRKLLLTLPEIDQLDGKNAAEIFEYLFSNPLQKTIEGGRERYLIMIDALDEASEGEKNSLVETLARHTIELPEWLGIIITSRPENPVTSPLQGLRPYVLDAETEENKNDIRLYLQIQLGNLLNNRSDAEFLIKQIIKKSEGVFLFIERVCDDLNKGLLSLNNLDQFPTGLGGIIRQFFDRQFPDLEHFRSKIRPALRAVLAAYEPLPLYILQTLFNWQDEELRDFLRILGSLFPISRVSKTDTIKPYHKSISDWLIDDSKSGPYFVSVMEGHRILGEFCLLQKETGKYFTISEAVYHLQFSENPEMLFNIFRNPAYYEAKFTQCGSRRLFDDLNCSLLHTSNINNQVHLNKWQPEVKTIFSIIVLILFGEKVSNTVNSLRRFMENGCNTNELESEREKLKFRIIEAENEPRISQKMVSPYVANTAHFYEEYIEAWLKAEDAALALNLPQLINYIKSALRFYAIYSCDGDPAGAVRIAIEEVAENIDNRLPIVERFGHWLDEQFSRISMNKSTEEQTFELSSMNSFKDSKKESHYYNKVGQEIKKETNVQSIKHNISAKENDKSTKISTDNSNDNSRTYSPIGKWYDIIDYGGKGYPQDMDFVCRKCGYREGAGNPNDPPDSCVNCGNQG